MGKDKQTRGTVFVALAANLVIAVAKAVGGLLTTSPALLSEAAHSVADTLNEVFLLAALRRSRRRPDARHPFGYGKERWFWSLLAAVGIFVMGGCFSFYQGVSAFHESEPHTTRAFLIAVAVLVISLLAEATSLVRALLQVRDGAREHGRPFRTELREGEDPTLRTVLGEDSAAVFGVLLALTGVVLHWTTGDRTWEAYASLAIAVLLMYVAYRLGKDCRDTLIGEAADPRLRQRAHELLTRQPEIDTVTALLTMRLGVDSVLLAARVDLTEGIDSETVEEAAVRIKGALAGEFPELDQIFLDVTDASEEDRRAAHRLRRALRAEAGKGGGGSGG
ncbi:cation diffusion facilitator family transporter [Actinacidiphila glaucinigra]|uniref:cation diffusion facilitator family transporter n=1 Tax=Actinacidiphila glaucinigra TaxID=235986 RepID=UPI0037C70D12